MKYFIISGEASGDLHGSNLVKQINALDQDADIVAWGGNLMESEGAKILKHYKELDFMGFIEVLLNLKTILYNIKLCKQQIIDFKPDVLILIDYPGFNLRIAEWAKKNQIKVHYYISPQIWAWKQNRVHKIKRTVDKMISILPFEKEFYAKFGVEIDYVGHPLLDAIGHRDLSAEKNLELKSEFGLEPDKKIILILPGSRVQEINAMLPIMLKQVHHYSNFQFVIAAAPSLSDHFFDRFLTEYPQVKVIKNRTYDLLQLTYAAMVTSGTATLETALFNVPEVVCYKGSFISYHIAKRIVKIKYISLVNLIMDQEVVKELIQSELNEELLKAELGKLLESIEYRQQMLDNFRALKDKLGGKGASIRSAQIIWKDLNA